MPDLERQLREDRILRDAARALITADLAHLKREVDQDSPSGADLSSRARDLADDTYDYVSGHRFQVGSIIAAIVAVLALWIFREPLAGIVREMLADDEAPEDNAEQAGHPDRSPDEPEITAETRP